MIRIRDTTDRETIDEDEDSTEADFFHAVYPMIKILLRGPSSVKIRRYYHFILQKFKKRKKCCC